ncbi:uncharacterized protein LOC127838082 [Dreissena polymorpha]|uniref:Uncharacterized protein n=1 Tax=Dreissena polymorpha TaxID=45954 RepID=A0A9D4J517_DREPO|nr:uncharacterized protein LOC127838082 [Dreissena polymorpha]XP_052221611.1 uncharacterized protein LOC127838082 [Dreissena polymorpha]KAH3795948.1 hypothetical protein DPMN_149510 [Dreissena polymorpha]
MFGQTPTALVAAREKVALTHGQILYGLVKPTKEKDQVESTAAMVNVIPKKRIYRMEKYEELDLFIVELSKRPLVLQPSAYVSKGLSVLRCSFYTDEEKWLLLINQNHPKIKSRIQMAMDAARNKMMQGRPFVMELSFNKFLAQVYMDRLTEEDINRRFTFVEFQDAEIVIRYPGNRASRSSFTMTKNNDIHFEFDDILPSEIVHRTVSDARSEWSSPALRLIMPDELQDLLRGWQFENIDPLARGDEYEEEWEDYDYEEEGAVGGEDFVPEEEPLKAPGKVLGRAARRANQAAKYEVSVDLHVPAGPVSQSQGNQYSGGRARVLTGGRDTHAYEDLNRGKADHAYAGIKLGAPVSPRAVKHGADVSPYEKMNSSKAGLLAQSPAGPRTPVSTHGRSDDRYNAERVDKYNTESVDRYNTERADKYNTECVDKYNSEHVGSYNAPRTPVSHSVSDDRYKAGYMDQTRPAHSTYLTDDDPDDGGFSSKLPPQRSPNPDSRLREADGHGNPPRSPYYPNDTYRSASQGQQSYGGRSQGQQNPGPGVHQSVAAPRGFHRQQGSGRSDTSASDSGFGENDQESSKYRLEKGGARSSGKNSINGDLAKTPYYNRAFEQESPERDSGDILARHKAIASRAIHGQGVPDAGGYNRTDRYNDPGYTRELQKWRQNINDLEDSVVPSVQVSRMRLQSDGERMEESFI